MLSEEVKEANNTRVTHMGNGCGGSSKAGEGNQQLYIETEGDEVACESVEAEEDEEEEQKSRISHESQEEEEEESSSQFEGTEKEEDDISIFEVITQKRSDKSPRTFCWLDQNQVHPQSSSFKPS